MARSNKANFDISSQAASELEYVIKKRHTADSSEDGSAPTATPQEAMSQQQIYKHKSDRSAARVLFISQNQELLNPTQQSLDGYIDLADLFDEVHILILRTGSVTQRPVLRAGDNVWIYTATATSWWKKILQALRLAEEQLVFANGFRPDLIVARDPYESGFVALSLAKKYNRPQQVHVLSTEPSHSWVRSFMRRYVLSRQQSVRVSTDAIKRDIQTHHKIKNLAVLPQYHGYKSILHNTASLDLKNKYKPIMFFMLHVGPLDHDSNLGVVLDAARFVLTNKRVGLLVIGTGAAKQEFKAKAKTLGIAEQVIFESAVPNLVEYMKACNLMIVSDTTVASESVVLQAAAAGAPLLMSTTEHRANYFVDGESAFMYRENDAQTLSVRINDLLNNVGLRKLFAERSQEIVRTSFHDELDGYKTAYRATLEEALFVDETAESER